MNTNNSILRYICILLIFAAGMIISGCTDLDIETESELTPDVFPITEEHYEAAKGIIYTYVPTNYCRSYWRLQSLSSDEAILPARGGDWDDGGQYRELHKHIWTPDNPMISATWENCFNGIIACNRVLAMLTDVPEGETKTRHFAEIRMMRAFFYYMAMDIFGNIPILRDFGDDTPTSPRADVFDFIESEIFDVLPYLPRIKDATTYGRPTQWMAHAMLARMYLNAEVYTGTSMYNETVEQCDSIIQSGLYALDADFKSMFIPTNGPGIQEFIFAIVYDANNVPGNEFTRYNLTPELKAKYSLGSRSPSNCTKTQQAFFDKFNLPGDVRNTTWLVGPQTNWDGSPITINTTYKGLDVTYSGPNPDQDTVWQISFSKEIWLRSDPEKMDVEGDLTGLYMGARSIKFYPDPNWNQSTRMDNNDFPVYRYAEILLMKAEAILRGAAPTYSETSVSLVNQLRTRASAPLVTDITLDELLDERARELSWEAHRRTDLIRYGKFSEPWLFKTEASPKYREIFPVPSKQLSLNPNLVQNPGYN